MGDVPFSVYFDFETATDDAVFFDSKIYVMCYCIIFSFKKVLNFHKIVIYRTFQQSAQELYSLDHFRTEHVPFIDGTTALQLKDAASAVLYREKCTSLAELFSIELKFTIDTLKAWFDNIKPNFFELDWEKKRDWRKKNPLTETIVCIICNLPLDIEARNGWFNHVAKSEHLF